jgi:hypothetical protein
MKRFRGEQSGSAFASSPWGICLGAFALDGRPCEPLKLLNRSSKPPQRPGDRFAEPQRPGDRFAEPQRPGDRFAEPPGKGGQATGELNLGLVLFPSMNFVHQWRLGIDPITITHESTATV